MFPRFPEVPSSVFTVDDATRQTRILGRACFFLEFLKFRLRRVRSPISELRATNAKRSHTRSMMSANYGPKGAFSFRPRLEQRDR